MSNRSYYEDLSNDEFEVWQNPNKGRVQVTMLDSHGQKRTELIRSGQKFHITPRERRINQEIVPRRELDVFENGMLVPVQLIENHEDNKSFEDNPNHMVQEEMLSMLKAHHKSFDARLAEITNVNTVQRLLELAQEDDSVTVRVVDRLRLRLEELDPSKVGNVETVGSVNTSEQAGAIKPVTL